MNELKTFNSEEFGEVRSITIDDELYFVGKDVAEVLGYANSRDALLRHVDEEDKKPDVVFHDGSQNRRTTLVNESGLYSLILSSKLPNAKQFKRWVTTEILPTIRKHGAYMTDEKLAEAILNPDTMINILTQLKEERLKSSKLEARNSMLTVQNESYRPKAEYFDDLVARNLLTNFRDTAKELKVKERSFINFLLDKKYIYRNQKGKLMPFSKHSDLFEVKETFNKETNWTGTQTLITPKGRETFRLLMIAN